jgi:hypothetical protein
MIHPYHTEDPRQLTDRLRQQWLRVRTQNRHLRRVSHRPDPAHVEPSVPSTRNKTRQHLSSYMTCCSVITIRVPNIDTGRVSA